ncbi:MAG: CapA family protein [Planctomycetota bacterium]|jgi:poly-gamma-glutamate synthesis protein (capsule biosynthesis protein)
MDVRDKFDYIITVLHVGNEYIPIPAPETINVCRSMAAAGSDVVIGHHAHIPQMTEIYEGVPVCYSLGNFLFGQKFNTAKACWHTCTIADITLDDDGAKLDIIPFRQLEDLHLHELGEKGPELLNKYFNDCLAILGDEEKYQKIWEQEARSKFGGNIAEGFASCFENLMETAGEDRKKEAKLFYNIFNCTTHRERMATGLRLLYDGKDANDDESQAVIEGLMKNFDEIIAE